MMITHVQCIYSQSELEYGIQEAIVCDALWILLTNKCSVIPVMIKYCSPEPCTFLSADWWFLDPFCENCCRLDDRQQMTNILVLWRKRFSKACKQNVAKQKGTTE